MDPGILAVASLYTFFCVAIVADGLYRPSERRLQAFADVHGIELTEANRPPLASHLRRAVLFRRGGGAAVFLLQVAAYVATQGEVVGHVGMSGLWVLAGYVAGAAVAEVVSQGPLAGHARSALLAPRRLSRYVSAWRLWPLRVLPVFSVALVWELDRQRRLAPDLGFPSVAESLVPAVGVLAVAVVVEVLLRVIAHRPQTAGAPDLLAANEALRSSSLHVLLGAGVAGELSLLARQVDLLAQPLREPGLGGALLSAGAFAVTVVAYVVWLYLSRPSRTPVRRLRELTASRVGA